MQPQENETKALPSLANVKLVFTPGDPHPTAATTPSTNKMILDYLLYLSIQSRLKQAQIELLELSIPLPEDKDDSVFIRQQRWQDTATKAEQDKNAVESIVAGILSGHQNKKPGFQVDSDFAQRLHLCQLTNLVFGRFDATSTGQHVIAHKSARRRRHETYMTSVIEEDTNESTHIKRRRQLYSQAILPPFCRRHRRQNCYGCRADCSSSSASDSKQADQDTSDKGKQCASPPPAGLIEAIPTFLKTSADMLRRALESEEEKDVKPMIFAGQRVMGGGMPPRWYDLFLELLTQAAIESYLCDTQAGLEPIFEIFSYGDVEDEDETDEAEDHEEEVAEDQDDGEDHHDVEDDDDMDEEDEWGVQAADHHLLFPKTRTMHLFKTQVREREKEFLIVEGDSLEKHYEKLAQKFPLETFEKNMGEFIQMILQTMETPALDKYENSERNDANNTPHSISLETVSSPLPLVYKYPGDGSLLMPEIPDEEDKDSDSHGVKRLADGPLTNNPPPKRSR
ncbi:uncharacterized protein BYT42DRAFT_568752 [Radiomyces spectabilis]|uniref:uncharacterized protein n=1 Tax=Radiomyces spectabilis TaxID=64574 RepID=UPI00221EC998|nr:uncharacterized protein BYT42DRAFT_568752 [Radiomyces spectabilis]KAI8379430.1 hypothetical protein BYT42DRAFT_568752 [Radiomyces spectabilis]